MRFEHLTTEQLKQWLVEYVTVTNGWGLFIEDIENEIERREKLEAYRAMLQDYQYFSLIGGE